MSFVTWAALAIGTLIVAPLLAHLLRRRPPIEQPFAAVALVPPSPAVTKRRRALEDRALLGLRALCILALGVLGATPLLRCSRLSIARQAGASVALGIVIDDSLSMRALVDPSGTGPTRFARALDAARELVDGLAPGDAVALVLAGDPARVVLAATTNLAAVHDALGHVARSDRSTDLDGAVARASEALRALPHVDKRVVLLSDLLDGTGSERMLEAEAGIRLWAPLTELRTVVRDCAVLRADHLGTKVAARVACSTGSGADAGAAAPTGTDSVVAAESPGAALRADRRVELRLDGVVVAQSRLDLARGATDLTFALPEGRSAQPSTDAATGSAAPVPSASGGGTVAAAAGERGAAVDGGRMVVALAGRDALDAIPDDDVAPVVELAGELRVGVVADPATNRVPTGGAQPVEQALQALGLSGEVEPLPSVPDEAAQLAPFRVLVVDDAPGFTPEARRHLGAWVNDGGVLLLALGPRSGSAPLGAGFDPLLPALVRWSAIGASEGASAGIEPSKDDLFGPTAEGLGDLHAAGRAELEPAAAAELRVRTSWRDGKPFAVEHRLGRGVTLAITLPFSTELSDFALRPAFLLLLQHAVDTARALGGTTRSAVGSTWSFAGYHSVVVQRLPLTASGELETLPIDDGPDGREVTPTMAGRYQLELDGRTTERVASVAEQEIVLGPRSVPEGSHAAELGGVASRVDVSRQVALVLLALIAAEIGLRVALRRKRRGRPAATSRA